MTTLNQDGSFLEKPSSIWLSIVSVIIAFAIALTTLQSGREVNAQNISELKANFESIDAKLDLLNDKLNEHSVNQAEIKTDLDYIKKELLKLER